MPLLHRRITFSRQHPLPAPGVGRSARQEGSGTRAFRDWLESAAGYLEPRRALEFALDVCRRLGPRPPRRSPASSTATSSQEASIWYSPGPAGQAHATLVWAKLAREAGTGAAVRRGGPRPPVAGSQVSLACWGGGTPPYLYAPEQWRREAVDARTDVYAVGCLLYELLTGRWPYQAATVEDLKRRHLEAPPPPLVGAGLRGLPGEGLDAFLARCLAKEPGERYLSASELMGAIAGLCGESWNWGAAVRGVPEVDGLPGRRLTPSRGGYP